MIEKIDRTDYPFYVGKRLLNPTRLKSAAYLRHIRSALVCHKKASYLLFYSSPNNAFNKAGIENL
jgi:hypothetical protein